VEITGNNEIYIRNIEYYDNENTLSSISLSGQFTYPIFVNSTNVNGFKFALGAWLTNQGYIYDHITVSFNDGKISFGQTNIDLYELTQLATSDIVDNDECCAISNVDLYAQTLVYQGNQIERMDWGVSCGGLQRYNFEYDMMHRLTNATYSALII